MVGFRDTNEGFDAEEEPAVVAHRVHFDPAQGRLKLALTNGGVMSLDPSSEPELAALTSEQLSGLMVGYAGVYLHHPDLDLNVAIRQRLAPFQERR